MYKFIKEGYTGGSVDVYKPTLINIDNNKKKKITRYDVNSLYPFAMKTYPMPCDFPTYFEGDILKDNNLSNDYKNKGYGNSEVDIIAPKIKIPLLQTRLKLIMVIEQFHLEETEQEITFLMSNITQKNMVINLR